MSGDHPRYATLQDYLRVIRRRRLLIVLITAAFVSVALGVSLAQPTRYTASAQLSFRDPLQDLVLVGQGGQAEPELSTAQRAAINAELVTSPPVSERAQEALDTEIPTGTLADAIETTVDVRTNLVVVSATWGDPEFAADLANAFANAAKSIGVRSARLRLERAQEGLIDELKDAKDETPRPGIRISIIEANLQRVQTLLTIANPVEIAQSAQPPGAPSSPRVAQNTILGAILGLVFALIAAFVRDALDRRLHNAQEVHEEMDMPVLGRIGESAFHHAGLAKNGLGVMSETEFEAFRVLRMNLAYLRQENPLRTVLVTSALPQEGKSTVSLALASAAALAKQRVMLVECDLRRPSFSSRLGLPREPGLTDYLSGRANPADILQVVALTEPVRFNGQGKATEAPGDASMVVISAGSTVSTSSELLRSPRFASFIAKVSKAYDLVILDGSPLLSVADPLELASAVEGILVCVRVRQTTRDQARAAHSALSHLPKRATGAVVTGLRPGDETYEYYYGY